MKISSKEVELLERLVELFKDDEVNWEGVDIELDKDNGVLHIVPLATVVMAKGTYTISFIKNALPLGVANIIRIFERNGLRYELYEHFRLDESGEIVFESQDEEFWKNEEQKTKEKEVKRNKDLMMYR